MAFLYVDRGTSPMAFVGFLFTVALHGGIVGAVWWSHHHAETAEPPGPGVFVDAKLVRFGKPRDMSFLPHKQGSVKQPPTGLKVAKDIDQAPNLNKDEKQDVDPLKKTRAELFKKMNDENEGVDATNVGSEKGSLAGTADEAKGDPYILEIIDKIGSQWKVPTTIDDSALSKLSADACLTIAADGTLTKFSLLRSSNNSQFDSSLEAALGSIKQLPEPRGKFAGAAIRGKLCPTFSKQ